MGAGEKKILRAFMLKEIASEKEEREKIESQMKGG